jgi:hypothetical protein
MNRESTTNSESSPEEAPLLVHASSVFQMSPEAEQLQRTFEKARDEGQKPKERRRAF